SAQMLGSDIDADVLLQINTQKDTIADGANQAFDKIPAPAAREEAKKSFTNQQNKYSTEVTDAFTKSLHQIFMLAATLMALSLVIVCFVKERPLRDSVNITPSE
ncbi:MAG TPA: hypothetical protein VLH14_00670, partial [Patescibacteria group bacterium]|nr:hypothetical protein [Patescibacteria group bacterium]